MALSVSDIKSAAAQAACFTCLPVNVQQAIKTYLLARVAGASTDPKTIMAPARGFIGLPPGTQLAIQAYAASVLSGAASASDFVKSQACAFQCTPAGMALPIAINQLAGRAGVSPVPKTLAALAKAFIGLPPGYLSALNTFLMAVIAGISTNAATAAKQAACFTCIPPANLENITTLIWTDVALPRPTGFTLIINPDGSVDIVWDPPPPGVSYTAIYLSFACDYNFVLYANVAAPGTTIHIPGIFGLSPGICIEIRSCSAAGLCSPPVGTGTEGGGGFVCPTMTVGAMLLDTMQSYTDQAALNGLNGGTGWCEIAAYVDRTAYLGLQALDTMQSYTNGANLVGLNGGTGWAGAYNADNVAITLAANAWADGSTPVTIAAVATGGFPAYTYQWYKDGTALSNAGHYSGVTTATLTITSFDVTDEASFTVKVTDTTARVFTSSACVTHEALTAGQLWAQQVNVNGGDWPAIATVNAADTFNAAISGLAARIYHLNFIAPDNLIAALTPFITTVGAKLWTKHVRGVPPAESITINGLKAGTNDTNGTVYDTGFAPNGVVAWTASNGAISVYAGEAVPPSSVNDLSGCYDGANAAIGIQANNGTNHLFILWDVTQRVQYVAAAAGGFYMASRTAANLLTAYFANSGNAWASTGTNVNNTGRTPNAQNVGVCGEIQAGPVYAVNPSRISFVAYHDGFNSADGQTLFNAVQSLRTSLGGGFV